MPWQAASAQCASAGLRPQPVIPPQLQLRLAPPQEGLFYGQKSKNPTKTRCFLAKEVILYIVKSSTLKPEGLATPKVIPEKGGGEGQRPGQGEALFPPDSLLFSLASPSGPRGGLIAYCIGGTQLLGVADEAFRLGPPGPHSRAPLFAGLFISPILYNSIWLLDKSYNI